MRVESTCFPPPPSLHTHSQVDTSTAGTQWGTGGMATKLTAARIATAAGCRMVICHYDRPQAITDIIAGQRIGTVFQPTTSPLRCAPGGAWAVFDPSGVGAGAMRAALLFSALHGVHVLMCLSAGAVLLAVGRAAGGASAGS